MGRPPSTHRLRHRTKDVTEEHMEQPIGRSAEREATLLLLGQRGARVPSDEMRAYLRAYTHFELSNPLIYPPAQPSKL